MLLSLFITSACPSDLQHIIDCLQEKGSSSWLTSLSIEQHGLVLHKVPLLMLFVCGMVGDFLGYLLTVFVGFQLHMHLAALTVPFLPSDITTFMTSLYPMLMEHYLQPLTGVCLDIYAAVFFCLFVFFWGGNQHQHAFLMFMCFIPYD